MTALLPILFDAALKGTVILALAAMVAAYLRRGSAAARHLVWHLAVIAVLVLPLVTLAMPAQLRIPVLPRFGIQTTALNATSNDPSAPPSTRQSGTGNVAPDAGHEPDVKPYATPEATSEATPVATAPGKLPLSAILFYVWLAGALLVIARFALGTFVVHWFTWRARPVNAISWASLNETMSFAVGLGHPVKLLKSERASTPMTFGVLNPVVLLPNDADEWPDERRRIVLLHELAHVQRLDCLTNIFATIACAVYWFNPLVWVAVRRMRAEGERACDDWVIRAGMRASTYAEHLLDMVKTIGRMHTPAAALPMAQRSTFEGRLLAILEPDMNRNGTRRGQAVMLTAVIALVVLPLAAMSSPAAAKNNDADVNRSDVASSDAENLPVSSGLMMKLGSRVGLITGRTRTTPPAVAANQNPAVAPAPAGEWSTKNAAISLTALNALLEALHDAETDVRMSTVHTLGELGDPRAIAALSEALRSDKDASVRRSAAWALGQIGDDKGVPALAAALRSDSDLQVRRTAAWAVGQIGSETAIDGLTAVLRDNDKELRSTAAWALGQIGDEKGVPALVTLMKDSDASIRNQAAWALGQIGDKAAVAPLTAALRDSDADVRKTAVWALGQIGDDTAAAALAPMLADGDAGVRQQVAWALGQAGSENAVPGLGRMLQDDKDVTARETAAWALGQIGDESSSNALAVGLKDGSASVRNSAAWALGQLDMDRAPQALVDALRDENIEVRRTAVWALGQIEDANSAPALRNAMKDSDPTIKRGAIRALARMRDETAYAALAEMLKDPDAEVRKQAAAALGGNGNWVDPRPRPRPQPRPRPMPRPNGG